MKYNCFLCVATGIFSAVAGLHLLRAMNGWELSINGWLLPLWVSWAAGLILTGLTIWGFKSHQKRHT